MAQDLRPAPSPAQRPSIHEQRASIPALRTDLEPKIIAHVVETTSINLSRFVLVLFDTGLEPKGSKRDQDAS